MLLLAVPACATAAGVGASPVAQPPAASVHAGGPPADLLAAIPFPAGDAADRAAAALVPLTVLGYDDYRCSDGSYDEDTHHVLPADLGELAWAMYRLPTNGFPALSLEVELQRLVGDSYFGIANFAKGSWEFSPALTTSHYIRGLNANHISPTNRVYLVIAAYNVSTTRVVQASIILDQPAWERSLIGAAPSDTAALQLFTEGAGGQPRLAVLTTRRIDYYQGPYQPEGPESWYSCTVVTVGLSSSLHRPFKAASVDYRPAIVYNYEGNYDEVRYSYASTFEPELDPWITTQVAGGLDSGSAGLGVCEHNGLPRVIFDAGYPVKACRLARSATAYPGSFDWELSTIADEGRLPEITCVNGDLAATFFSGETTVRVKYARALTAEPSGPASWDVIDASNLLPINYYALLDIAYVPVYGGEAPVILHRTMGGHGASVACSTAPEPANLADWNSSFFVWTGETDFQIELKTIRDTPAVLYYLPEQRRLELAWSASCTPATVEEWTVMVIDTDLDVGALALAEVAGWPAVAYYDSGTHELKYAYYME